jgi:hypothetical protein
LFDRKNAAGTFEGYRPLGNCTEFNVSIESEQFEHFSSESGLEEKDLEFTRRVNRTGSITTDNMSKENLELFLAAEATTVDQASGTVTNEVIGPVTADRTYQLGTSVAPGGVRNVSAVTFSFKEGDDAASRANSTAYTVGQFYKPATPNSHFYVCTVAGTSAGSPPSFTTDGTTFTDGTATFRNVGLIAIANTAEADVIIDGDLGLVSPTPTGLVAAALSRLPAGSTLRLNVDYTKAAITRDQIATTGSASLNGRLKFISDNPYGDQQDVFIPDCSLAPNGDLPFITGDELAAAQFNVGINKLDSNTAAIYIDGRPEE